MKAVAKLFVFYLCRCLVAPLYILYVVQTVVRSKDRAFVGIFQGLSMIPGITGVYIRAAFFSLVNPAVSKDIAIGFLTLFSHTDTVIGTNVYIGPQSNIGKCKIGDNCLIGSGVHILSGKHQHSFSDKTVLIKDQPSTYTSIEIGENTWIGNNTTIMANISKNCVIAAGSVVTKDVAENQIFAGNPAKRIRSVFPD